MKILYISLIWSLLAFVNILSAQGDSIIENKKNISTNFAQAYALQSEGKNAEAIEIYKNIILSNTLVSAEVFNNLGLAYLAENKIGEAVLNFSKTIKYAPHLKAGYQNLAVAQSHVNDLPKAPKNTFKTLLVSLSNGFSSNGWFFIALMASLVLSTLFFLEKKLLIVKIGATILMIISIVFSFVAKNISSTEKAVILHDKVMLKQSADLGAQNVGEIFEGTTMEILEKQGDWLKILLADGVVGWIPVSIVTII